MALLWVLPCLLVGRSAPANEGSEIRVLLHSSPDAVRVGVPGAAQEIRLLDRGGVQELFVPGQGRLRRWDPQGPGPWRVGPRTVRGQISVRVEAGRIEVLNRVDLEHYVASTVGGEMMSSWPREALRAQAVAARTYALHQARKQAGAAWDVRATTQSQVYGGLDAETAETRAAARATAREVMTYAGQPILAVFHSTAGGRTEAAGEVWGHDLPYLRVLEVDDEDDAPHTYWRMTVAARDLERLFEVSDQPVGRLEAIDITERTRGERVKRLTVRGSRRAVVLEGDRLRTLVNDLGLRSRLFEIRVVEDGFAFVGSGYGHGVGMSQWGARAMARRGESYEQILETFYPGARLETWEPRRIAESGPGSVTGRTGFPGRNRADGPQLAGTRGEAR